MSEAQADCVLPDVVIAHDGNQAYSIECVAAARRYGRVHRITFDEPDNDPQYRALRAAYVHLSGGSVRFELTWCLRRYFLMRNLLRAKNIASAWLLDSDVLLVDALPDPALFPAGTVCAMSMSPVSDELDRHYSAHCSYWTLTALDDFCGFLVRSHRDGGEALRALDRRRRARGIHSAVGEMILLAQWATEQGRVFNLFEFSSGGIIDHNLRFTEQPSGVLLKSQFGNKRLLRASGGIFAEALDGSRIRMRCVHFQGHAKSLMADFARGRMAVFYAKASIRYLGSAMQHSKRRIRRGLKRFFHSDSHRGLPPSTMKS